MQQLVEELEMLESAAGAAVERRFPDGEPIRSALLPDFTRMPPAISDGSENGSFSKREVDRQSYRFPRGRGAWRVRLARVADIRAAVPGGVSIVGTLPALSSPRFSTAAGGPTSRSPSSGGPLRTMMPLSTTTSSTSRNAEVPWRSSGIAACYVQSHRQSSRTHGSARRFFVAGSAVGRPRIVVLSSADSWSPQGAVIRLVHFPDHVKECGYQEIVRGGRHATSISFRNNLALFFVARVDAM